MLICVDEPVSLINIRAYEDAIATHELYLKLYNEFKDREEAGTVFEPHEMIYQVKREGPATPRQKERLARLVEERKIVLKVDINHITKNIQQLLKALNQSFSEINTLTDTQSGSINEFSTTIQEISTKALQLAQFAEEILYDKEN